MVTERIVDRLETVEIDQQQRLRPTALQQTLQRQVEAVAYEPKVNVTPNAVALKDD